MKLYSVTQTNMHPAPHVIAVESPRAAQIIARLLAERFPGIPFGVDTRGVFAGPDCHGSIADSARSFEVQAIVKRELDAEATDNPHAVMKWRVFFYDAGSGRYRFKVNTYLDHDLKVCRQCEADPELTGQAAIFGDMPTLETLYLMLDAAGAAQEAIA